MDYINQPLTGENVYTYVINVFSQVINIPRSSFFRSTTPNSFTFSVICDETNITRHIT